VKNRKQSHRSGSRQDAPATSGDGASDSSLRNHDRDDGQGRVEPVQTDSNEQSGSTGRHTGVDEIAQGKDTGQDRYGQSGCGGNDDTETIGQAAYRKSGSDSEQERRSENNDGSGRADHEVEEYHRGRPARRARGPSK
jgi:hypothetical protein